MYFRTCFVLCVLMLAAFAYAGQFDTQQVFMEPTGHYSNHLDVQEPDTIAYDDDAGNIVYLSTWTNFWSYVRFTPPAAFDLHSIYFVLYNPNGNTSPCSLFVYTPGANHLPGTLLARAAATPQQGAAWYDVTLTDTVHIAAQQDFLIVLGRAVSAQGWTPALDGASTGDRTWISNQNVGRTAGPYQSIPYDLRIRAGGVLATYIDMSAEQCYNSVNNGHGLFFMPTGSSVTWKAQVMNHSTAAVDAYTVSWSVTDAGGAEVFTNEVAGTTIQPDAIAQLTASQAFTPTTAGEYVCHAIVHADNDAATDNDTTLMRIYVGDYPHWYSYDDGTGEGSTSFGSGAVEAISYRPASYSTRIDSVSVDVGADDPDGNVSIYMSDPVTLKPTGAPIWSSNPGVTAGHNAFAVDPSINIFQGQTFSVAYNFGDAAGLSKDANVPNAANITRVDTVAWQGDGTAWDGDVIGNWMLSAYLDTSSAQPTYPIIALSEDTLNFGNVDTTGNTSSQLVFRIYNNGGQDPLHLDSLYFPLSTMRTVFSVSAASRSIDAGDSTDITVTFNPNRVQAYLGKMYIENNSNNARHDSIVVRGAGVRATAADDHDLRLPTTFALAQNFPNPFNPTTDIQFALPVQSQVRLTVFDVLGQEVKTLVNGSMPAGIHTAVFDGASLPSGIYFYRLEAGNFTAIHKMMLMK